jgi:hypothetical protein
MHITHTGRDNLPSPAALAVALPILVLACDRATVKAYTPTAEKVAVPVIRQVWQSVYSACGIAVAALAGRGDETDGEAEDDGSGCDELRKEEGMRLDME